MATLNLLADQGSDFLRTITIKDDDGNPLDLTGRTYEGAAKFDYRLPSPSFEFTITLKNQTTNPGEITFLIPASETRDLRIFEATKYFYDVKEVNGSLETLLFSGVITLNPRVTK
jgi:hypothetical protein